MKCRKCRLEHPRCAGHNKAGKPCGRVPARLQDVCRLHGGASPQALEAARRKAAELAAAEVVARWAEGREVAVENPVVELSRIAGEALAFKDYLRDQVRQLDGQLAYWQEQGFEDDDGHGFTKASEDMRAVVGAYERALDRVARILGNIVKLDLAGRMLELNTATATVMVSAVREGLARVDMAAEVRKAAETAIGEALANVRETTPREIPAPRS